MGEGRLRWLVGVEVAQGQQPVVVHAHAGATAHLVQGAVEGEANGPH